MALTFCGKKSEVGASVSYGHISSFTCFDCLTIIASCHLQTKLTSDTNFEVNLMIIFERKLFDDVTEVQ